jgi:hypothetical protein
VSKAWPVDGIEPRATLAENARKILAVRVGEFFSYAPAVHDPRAGQELHDLRIAAKRLRYTLELFLPVFGEVGERNIERIRAIQEALGDYHDHDVRIALIERELAELAVEQSAELARLFAAAPTVRHHAIAAAALRPPPDDPRAGLLALLGRQYASRSDTRQRFEQLWRQYLENGMRAELVALSSRPLEDPPIPPSAGGVGTGPEAGNGAAIASAASNGSEPKARRGRRP